MSFKVGDIVYCINYHININDKTSSVFNDLEFNVPYIVDGVFYGQISIKPYGRIFNDKRFLLKEEFILINRLEKIKKIKTTLLN